MKWKALMAVSLGLLMIGMVSGNPFPIEQKRTYTSVPTVGGYWDHVSTAKIYNFLRNDLNVSINYSDLVAIQRISPRDLKQAKELKASGLNASEISILRLMKKIQLMEFVSSRSGGDPNWGANGKNLIT